MENHLRDEREVMNNHDATAKSNVEDAKDKLIDLDNDQAMLVDQNMVTT